MQDDEDTTEYRVVLNHEEQYSIWPVDQDLPAGWRADGVTGSKEECLAHIDEVWTDMRPLSLRIFMREQERLAAEGLLPEPEDDLPEAEPLVERLSRGDHPVELTVRPDRDMAAVRASIERGQVFLRFTDTDGGTELGVRLDPSACDLTAADYDGSSGEVRLVGDLTLDFEPVRCEARVELATLTGRGFLTPATG